MHIPDGFLSTPVWATFDAIALPGVALIAHRASRTLDDGRIPLLGMMGAFVFAAQMINFPVAAGTSGHLVGGALLAIVLGPWAAALVMTAILAIQAFVFQDGGILALGVNIFNMGVVGVFAGYLPYLALGRTLANTSLFLAGTFSVLISATCALVELLISGVKIQRHLLMISMIVFAISAVIEGIITLAAVRAIERLNPKSVRAPQPTSSPIVYIALAVAIVAIVFASQRPDALQQLLPVEGESESHWIRQALSSLAGILGAFGVCYAIATWIAHRKRSA